MRLLISEMADAMPAAEQTINTMKRAAEVCLMTEGIDPDAVEISLSFVTPEEIHALNREYRDVDRVTDVLSFPMVEDLNELPGLEACAAEPGESSGPEENVGPKECDDAEERCDSEEIDGAEDDWLVPLGDVVICLEQAEAQAKEYGHSREREIVYLFVHSVLHLLGYDHMEPEEQRLMRAREEEVMAAVELTR